MNLTLSFEEWWSSYADQETPAVEKDVAEIAWNVAYKLGAVKALYDANSICGNWVWKGLDGVIPGDALYLKGWCDGASRCSTDILNEATSRRNNHWR